MRESASGRWHGSVRRSPSAVSHSRGRAPQRARIGTPPKARFAGEEGLDDVGSFLRLERAGAVDQGAARLGDLGRPGDEAPLQRRERGNVGRALEPGNVGMAADGAGRRAGRIEQHRVERAGAPLRDVGGDGVRREPQACEFCRSRSSRPGERSTAITRAPAAASCAVLPPGAAQRSATVGRRRRRAAAPAAPRRRPAPTRRPRHSPAAAPPAHARPRAPSRSASTRPPSLAAQCRVVT